MYIYCIENLVNNKKYIGQTTAKNPLRRKNEHFLRLRKGIHDNPHLQYSWNKYGEKQFSFKILKTCNSQQELDINEEYFRKMFLPNVYNIRTGGFGGSKFSDGSKKKMSINQKKRAKELGSEFYRYISMKKGKNENEYICNGKIITDENITKRYSEHGKLIWKNASKETKLKMGWAIRQLSSEEKSKQGKINWQNSEYRAKFTKSYEGFIDPNGKIYSPIVGIRQFARINNLDAGELIKVYNGKRKQHKGWRKYSKDDN